MSTKIYGASDDCVEFEGDVSGEVSCYDSEGVLVACSDGTILKVAYGLDTGIWRIEVLNQGKSFDRLERCENEDGDDGDYSDVVYLKDGVKSAWSAAENWEKVG